VTLSNGAVRNSIGGLAGSSLTLDQGIRNIIAVTGANLATASQSATSHPADVLKLHDRGTLVPGAIGDAVLLDDLQVVATIVGGSIAFNRYPERLEGPSHAAP
jgi:N-acetylglucosamine-6-phosphate deacetylase